MTTAEILAKATNRPWDEYTLCALRSVEEDEANEQLCVLAVNSYEANEVLIEKLADIIEGYLSNDPPSEYEIGMALDAARSRK